MCFPRKLKESSLPTHPPPYPPLNSQAHQTGYGTTYTGYGTTSVGCKGVSRYVEGCWGFPHLKSKKFISSFCIVWCWFIGFKNPYIFKNTCYMLANFDFVLLIDIDLISMILEISLNGSSSFFGACLFEHCQHFGFPENSYLQT